MKNYKLKHTIAFLFLLISQCFFAQVKLLSWNLENFGKSKSNSEISFMAAITKDYDVIAIQEVVAGYGGAQAVARLADELNRKGSQWDYTISDPTSSTANKTERYAFIWKTARLKKIGRANLEKKYAIEIEREPYLCTFEYQKKSFTIASFHAITKSKQPEKEIKFLKFLPAEYTNQNIIITGDFNCPQSHSVFYPFRKMGFESALIKQKTTLKRSCKNNKCLASEFDNMFYFSSKIKKIKSGVVPFYEKFEDLKAAHTISDHCPIWMEFNIN